MTDPDRARTRRPAQAAAAATTLGELRAGGYRPRSVKAELRANLMSHLAADEPIFPGIVGLRGQRHPGRRERHPRRPGHRLPRASGARRRRGSPGC